jgi:Arc/MetJ-type ribon-helix-helix transcriptional regulator
MSKQRLSASVGADLIRAAEQAVADGRAESVSAWVDEAMRRHVEHDKRLRALAEFISAWEAEHGEITHEEMEAAARTARRRSFVVRGGTVRKAPKAASRGAERKAPAKRQGQRKSA